MKKSKTILIIRQLLSELEDESNLNYIWLGKARGYISNIFGKSSFQYDRFYRASFYENIHDKNQETKDRLVKVLNDGIETINHFGAYKEPKSNFLSRIPTWLLAIIITGMFSFAVMIGQILSDRQNFDLKQENKELKEKLSIMLSDSISNKKEKQKDTPNDQ